MTCFLTASEVGRCAGSDGFDGGEELERHAIGRESGGDHFEAEEVGAHLNGGAFGVDEGADFMGGLELHGGVEDAGMGVEDRGPVPQVLGPLGHVVVILLGKLAVGLGCFG